MPSLQARRCGQQLVKHMCTVCCTYTHAAELCHMWSCQSATHPFSHTGWVRAANVATQRCTRQTLSHVEDGDMRRKSGVPA